MSQLRRSEIFIATPIYTKPTPLGADARPPRQGRIIQLARRKAECIPVRIFKEDKTSPGLFFGFTEKLDSAGLELSIGLVEVVGVKHDV